MWVNGKHSKKSICEVGQFLINLELVSRESLKAMRSFWPKKDYEMIKNRKSARLARIKMKHRSSDPAFNNLKKKVGRPRIKKLDDNSLRQ